LYLDLFTEVIIRGIDYGLKTAIINIGIVTTTSVVIKQSTHQACKFRRSVENGIGLKKHYSEIQFLLTVYSSKRLSLHTV